MTATTLVINGPVNGILRDGDVMEIKTSADTIEAIDIWDALHRTKKCRVL